MKAFFISLTSLLPSNSRFLRVLSLDFNNPNPPSHDPDYPPPPATAIAPMDVESTSSAEANPESATVLAIPGTLSLGIYASIPQAIHLDPDGFSLYYPLVVSCGLAIFSSVCSIIYTRVQLITIGIKKVMIVACMFTMIAFGMRVLLPLFGPGREN